MSRATRTSNDQAVPSTLHPIFEEAEDTNGVSESLPRPELIKQDSDNGEGIEEDSERHQYYPLQDIACLTETFSRGTMYLESFKNAQANDVAISENLKPLPFFILTESLLLRMTKRH